MEQVEIAEEDEAYIDCNIIYTVSLCSDIGFEWVIETELQPDESDVGYILVNREYPDKLHRLHIDFPLCRENQRLQPFDKTKKLLLMLEEVRITIY